MTEQDKKKLKGQDPLALYAPPEDPPEEVLDTLPGACRRKVSSPQLYISKEGYIKVSNTSPVETEDKPLQDKAFKPKVDPSISTGKPPTTTTTYKLESKKERKKESLDPEKYRAYFEFPVEMQPKWVPISLRVIPEIYEAWSTAARQVEVTRYKNGKLQQALTKSMLLYLAENEAALLDSLIPARKVLDTPIQRKVSNTGKALHFPDYPIHCKLTNIDLKEHEGRRKRCANCTHNWARVGCIHPEKAAIKEKNYLKQHPMEALLQLGEERPKKEEANKKK